jgi:hypothetical protein
VGREARCSARWGKRSGEVKALLETTEIIVRGAFRDAAPLAELRNVRADGDTLRFSVRDEDVALVLGAAAPRWAAKIAAPPPSLAVKLGIGATTRLFVTGRIDDPGLATALDAAKRTRAANSADMIVARVDDADALARIAETHRARLERGIPLWVIYTKGKAAPLGETTVRATMRERGLIDLKVASVSPSLTALKFARTVKK